ncbi:MAG: HepT-like ribonuclease domain-containing protein [Bryobacteraceae bacterium]
MRKSAPEFAEHRSEIPWAVMYAMRNRLTHACHKVDYEIV